MRFKYTVVIFLIVVVGAPTSSVTGQEEPLPAIQAKGSFEPLTPQIVLASYPIRADVQPSLVDAVRANDYVTFDALYRANPTPAFATLHELWTYSITDPIGAFYGQEMHDRFARAYPGYAKYIEEFRIVDRNGNVFYPTSETRAFLLDRALDGRAPRVQIANATPRAAATPRRESAAPRTPSRRNLTPATTRSTRTATRSTATPVTAPVAQKPVAQAPVAQTPVVQTPPVVAETAPAVVETPVVETPTVVRAEQTPAPAPVTEPAVAQPIRPADNNFGGRGILLLVIGMIGIGLLAMMLRTPREVQPTSIMPPTDNTVTPPPVEPIRRPSAAPPPPPPGKNRASGSHG